MAALAFVTLFVAGLLLSGLVVFSNPLANARSLYILFGGVCGMLALMLLSMWYFRRVLGSRSPPPPVPLFDRQWSNILPTIGTLGLIGTLCRIGDFALTVRYVGLDLVTLREVVGARDASALSYPANILAPFVLITLAVTILCYERLPKFHRIFGMAVGTAMPVIDSLAQAGRGGIVELMMMIPFFLLQRPILGRSVVPKTSFWRVGMPIIVLFTIMMLGMISVVRSEEKNAQYEAALLFNSNVVKPAPWIVDRLGSMNPILANVLVEGLLYWTGPVVAFDKVEHNWNLAPAHLSAFFPIINRRLVALGVSPSPLEIWNEQSRVMMSYQMYPNMFITTPGTMIVSMGRVASIVVQFAMAVLASFIYVRGRMFCSVPMICISVVFSLWCFLWFQKSLFIYPLYEYTAYIAILYVLIKPIVQSNRPIILNTSGRAPSSASLRVRNGVRKLP